MTDEINEIFSINMFKMSLNLISDWSQAVGFSSLPFPRSFPNNYWDKFIKRKVSLVVTHVLCVDALLHHPVIVRWSTSTVICTERNASLSSWAWTRALWTSIPRWRRWRRKLPSSPGEHTAINPLAGSVSRAQVSVFWSGPKLVGRSWI